MPNRVRWEDLSPDIYEDMCSVLISKLHPDFLRIDGSGGDGGRDVQVPTASGLQIFEMKSFTGRVDSRRRRQVEKSLARAAQHQPVAWHLVVPIDPTPNEEEWFRRLALQHQFPCYWKGRSWLDSQMAAHLDIPRYYLEGSRDEIVEVLRELAQEKAALTRGVPDAVERLQMLSTRLNKVDPHYSFGLSAQPDGTVSVSVWPKYKGAERNRPMQLNASFLFPDNDEGRVAADALKNSLDYGIPAVVPSQFLRQLDMNLPAGLGSLLSSGEVRIGPTEQLPLEDFNIQLRLVDARRTVVAQLPLLAKARSVGMRGGSMTLTDHSGAIAVDLRIDAQARRLNLHYEYSDPPNVLPSAIIPAIRFMAQLIPGNSMVIAINGVGASMPTAIERPVDGQVSDYLSLLRALDEIQQASGVYFMVPHTLTLEDLSDISLARRLLAGETVTGAWSRLSVTTTIEGLEAFRDQVATGVSQLVSEADMTLSLAGHEIPIGRVRKVLLSVKIAEWPTLPDDASPDTPVELVFEPGTTDQFTSVVLRPGEESMPEGLGD